MEKSKKEFINSLFNEDDISRLLFEAKIILQDASFSDRTFFTAALSNSST